MSLRIISGIWKGRTLPPPHTNGTRPSTDTVRTMVFNYVTACTTIDGAIVWDLFAGTGAYGFECLSRGATACTFVDSSAIQCKKLHDFAARVNATGHDIVRGTVRDFIHSQSNSSSQPTIVFADPPYADRVCNALLNTLTSHVADSCVCVLEHGPYEFVLPQDGWTVLQHKEVGQVVFDIVQRSV